MERETGGSEISMLSGVRCTFFPAARGFVFSVFDSAAQGFTLVFWWRERREEAKTPCCPAFSVHFLPLREALSSLFFDSAARGFTLGFLGDGVGGEAKAP